MPIATKEIEVPCEPGLRITIRKLSYWQVKEAQRARLSEVMAMAREVRDFQDLIATANPEMVEAARARSDANPADSFDMQKTLHFGIVAWSYPEDVKASTIDDLLAPDAAEFIFREIIAFSTRPVDEKKDWQPVYERLSTPAAGEDGP